MKNLSQKLDEIKRYIVHHNISTVSFDIDGTLYPLKKVELRWWKNFFLNPFKASRFLNIRKKWEKRRAGKVPVPVTSEDIIFFESFLTLLLNAEDVPKEIHAMIDDLIRRGTTVYFLTDHGAEVKITRLRLSGGIPVNCLSRTGELKPHAKISELLVNEYKIIPGTHLHLGDRWSDEEQARLMGSHFLPLKP